MFQFFVYQEFSVVDRVAFRTFADSLLFFIYDFQGCKKSTSCWSVKIWHLYCNDLLHFFASLLSFDILFFLLILCISVLQLLFFNKTSFCTIQFRKQSCFNLYIPTLRLIEDGLFSKKSRRRLYFRSRKSRKVILFDFLNFFLFLLKMLVI